MIAILNRVEDVDARQGVFLDGEANFDVSGVSEMITGTEDRDATFDWNSLVVTAGTTCNPSAEDSVASAESKSTQGPFTAADTNTLVRGRYALKGCVDEATATLMEGWAWDPQSPHDRIRLELIDGDTQLATTVADVHRPGLNRAGVGDGNHAFRLELKPGSLSKGRRVLHLRCADTGTEMPGSPFVIECPDVDEFVVQEVLDRDIGNEFVAARPEAETLSDLPDQSTAEDESPFTGEDTASIFSGHVDGVHDDWTLGGWAYDPTDGEPLTVELSEHGFVIAEARANRFREDLLAAGCGSGSCAFHIRIPPSLFDGKFHQLRVYAVAQGRRGLVGAPFGIVLPRYSSDASKALPSAAAIYQQVTGITPSAKRPDAAAIQELTSIFQQLGIRFGHATALRLLYTHILHRPIDAEGLVTRLTRIKSDVLQYERIVEEIMLSDEAAQCHRKSNYSAAQPVSFLSIWLSDRLSLLELKR